MEADANVTFTHMAPLELAVSLARCKQAWLKLHPETAAGVAGAVAKHGLQTKDVSFADFMATIWGLSKRRVEQIIAAGERLDREEAKALKGAPKRLAMKDLAELGRIGEADERAAVVRLLAALR